MKRFEVWAEACWDGYKQVGMKKKGKKMVPNCVPEEDESELEEMTPAAMKRRKKAQAHLKKTMKKYGDAAKMGIDAKDVNQRRNAPTRKKSS